jgi:glycosyltransferase involved in cell wall biosynthesis
MKILITTGLSKGDVGGPAQYGLRLKEEFEKIGYKAKIVQYGSVESAFFKILPQVLWADRILALDTFSVGLPSVLLAKLFGKKVTVRIGGDFLWESYVERTGRKITLSQFNTQMPKLSIKEKLILHFTKILTKLADGLAFNTEWQKNIWHKTYNISSVKSCVVRNYIPDKNTGGVTGDYFLWAGRKIKLKNTSLLKELSKEFKIEMVSGLSHDELQNKIKSCYAVVLPSMSEVCPNFILEAISYNKPFIMTEETGLKEIYNRGGIFINPFDKKALKEAILSMLDTVQYRQHQEALLSYEPRSWRKVAEDFLSIWQ